jgi:hypothetical protein
VEYDPREQRVIGELVLPDPLLGDLDDLPWHHLEHEALPKLGVLSWFFAYLQIIATIMNSPCLGIFWSAGIQS